MMKTEAKNCLFFFLTLFDMWVKLQWTSGKRTVTFLLKHTNTCSHRGLQWQRPALDSSFQNKVLIEGDENKGSWGKANSDINLVFQLHCLKSIKDERSHFHLMYSWLHFKREVTIYKTFISLRQYKTHYKFHFRELFHFCSIIIQILGKIHLFFFFLPIRGISPHSTGFSSKWFFSGTGQLTGFLQLILCTTNFCQRPHV